MHVDNLQKYLLSMNFFLNVVKMGLPDNGVRGLRVSAKPMKLD